ncbi:Rieske (2Fe-2S) protein [Solihabitans fulvus]|uniref:Rieske (2Fe-2S) protein n=1 Tax=Solihabitans fulvus TaxID=1892852 RepID=A0A5B2XEP5_9PSEU|nr:Rieske (2Fe-2S) protein [Solihabitans fulvus]
MFGRRSVLCGAIALASGALVACGGGGPSRTGGIGSAKPGDRLAALAEVPVGGGTLVDVAGNGRLLLVRPTKDDVRAFNPACPHAGTIVNPPGGGVITCPTHGSQFDAATGDVRKGPSTSGLARFAVRIEGDHVVLA